jgi:hypothetical protein
MLKPVLFQVLFLALLCCTLLAGADNGRGRHKKVYAVPVPRGTAGPTSGKVTIDGKLTDWDLSGQILTYVISETSEMQSARFAAMYDTDALYLAGVVRDPSPMMNRHDPNVDPEKAWDADVCQLFMSLDPALGYPIKKSSFSKDVSEKMCTLLLWHYTDRQEANLVALKAMTFSEPLRPDLSKNGVIPRDKFQGAYRKAEDGLGYTLEYRIPWATLGVPAPKAGDILATTVCFFWGTPDGLKTAGGAAWCYDVMGEPGFPFQSSACWGKLIFSPKGNLPKALVEEGIPPERPLPLKFTYDLPDDSEATVQLFDERGYCVRTLVASGARRAGVNIERWDGLDDAGQPLPAGTYTWKGLTHQPINTKFILAAHNSGKPPYKLDDNTGGWGGDHGNATTACAVGDRMILAWEMCESGWGIICTDLKGKKLWGSKHNAEDIATDGTRLFVLGDNGYDFAHQVKVFDAKDCRPLNWGNGNPALQPPPEGDPLTNNASGVAYAKGKVYVAYASRDLIAVYDALSGALLESWNVRAPHRLTVRPDGSLAVISDGRVLAATKEGATPFIATGLDQPVAITSAADGALYVANRGALQNIAVFDGTGKYLRSIGKAGGRARIGRYEKDGLLEPGGITLDKAGNLWAAETLDAPKRHSVWDPKSGTLLNEFFGASSYFGWAYMDPKHPDELYCHNVLWKIDLVTGACTPQSTIWRPTKPNMIAQPNPGGYAGHFRVITAKNGKQYGWGMIDYSPMLFLREGEIFKPVAGSIRIAFGQYGGGLLYPAMDGIYKKTKAGAYLWQDKNDDQCVQEDELVVSPAGRGETTFNWIDPDLNVWCDDGYMYKPTRIEADGRPIYDFSRRTPLPFKGGNANGTSLIHDATDDTVYTLAPGGNPGLARWTSDGQLLWSYRHIEPWGSALNKPVVSPGKLWGLTMPLGVAGDFTGAACYFGPYHLFTRDGLYVAMIMRDGRTGGLGADITASETITGQLVKPEGMNRYFLLAGDQDGRVTEILGLDTVKRLPGGEYVHRPEDVTLCTDALADYQRLVAKGQRLDIVRGKAALSQGKSVGKRVDDTRAFTARAAYDATNLYVAYEVASPYDLTNEIADPQRLFKGGNCLDLQLAADPKADPKRKRPAPGDLRLLVTRQAGKPVAVLFRPKVKGFTGQPLVMTSPTGKEAFDKIDAVTVGLEYKKVAGGFQATVTIPLALLGWMPQPGGEVKLDLGYLFGNPTGNMVAARAYWRNNGFAANVTNDVPNESRLEPGEWGTATVE